MFLKFDGAVVVWHAKKKKQTEYLEYSLLISKSSIAPLIFNISVIILRVKVIID